MSWGPRAPGRREDAAVAALICDSTYLSLSDTVRHHLSLARNFVVAAPNPVLPSRASRVLDRRRGGSIRTR